MNSVELLPEYLIKKLSSIGLRYICDHRSLKTTILKYKSNESNLSLQMKTGQTEL